MTNHNDLKEDKEPTTLEEDKVNLMTKKHKHQKKLKRRLIISSTSLCSLSIAYIIFINVISYKNALLPFIACILVAFTLDISLKNYRKLVEYTELDLVDILLYDHDKERVKDVIFNYDEKAQGVLFDKHEEELKEYLSRDEQANQTDTPNPSDLKNSKTGKFIL